jgi:creatinine amidohydrolase
MADEVRLERMRPAQIAAAKMRRAAVYVPFGAVEWHGLQNPVGLDGLKAQGQLAELARRVGGVVYPPVFFGAGGGHGDWALSYMVEPAEMKVIVTRLLHRFERDGFEAAILLSGHYPNYWEYLKPAREAYMAAGGKMRVLAIIENQVAEVKGDHAALYETSSMLHLMPETVDMGQLAGRDEDRSGSDESKNWMGAEWQGHPLYGLVGSDPRGNASADMGRTMTERLLAALGKWLRGEEQFGRTWE